jgi:hypothetical protein
MSILPDLSAHPENFSRSKKNPKLIFQDHWCVYCVLGLLSRKSKAWQFCPDLSARDENISPFKKNLTVIL